MINKQRKPCPQHFSLGVAIVYTFLFLQRSKKSVLRLQLTDTDKNTVTNAKVLFFKTFQLYNTDGALFNFY